MGGNAWHIAHNVADAHQHLILDLFITNDGDRLWNITQRSESLSSAPYRIGLIASDVNDSDTADCAGNLKYHFEGTGCCPDSSESFGPRPKNR